LPLGVVLVAGASLAPTADSEVVERKVTTYEVDGGVALVHLDRPDRLNAWTARMELEYRDALAEADDDPGVRVVVVTGKGRGFCAGADTTALTGIVETGRYGSRQVAGVGSASEQPDVSGAGSIGAASHKHSASEQPDVSGAGSIGAANHQHAVRPDFEHAFSYAYGLRKPLIAAINGPAAGVGFVVACFADIRFAAEGAKLTTSFGRLGLPAEHGVSWVLSRLVGPAHAADLLFSSRVVLAEEAERMGLVNAVFPPAELLPHTLEYAHRMASEVSPWSLLALKRQLYADQLRSLDEAATDAERLMAESFGSPDFKEGVAALTEKRRPSFGGLA
jgi:enoyl-CoA hydratase/carnithine racemase